MHIRSIFLFIIFTRSLEITSGFRILVIYPMPKQSHFKVVDRISRGLADKGHQVDFLSIMNLTSSHPNYTQVVKYQDITNPVFSNYDALRSRNLMSTVLQMISLRCEAMGDPQFMNFARNPPKDRPYDLILTMIYYPCYLILAHLHNIPVVHLATSPLPSWMYGLSGNPENMIFSPNLFITPLAEGNDFWSRFYNTHVYSFIKFYFLHNQLKLQDKVVRNYFGSNMPAVHDMIQNVSLTLVNSYFPIHGNIPTTANLVEIGGIHIENDNSKYASSLNKWLDESKSGVVYFSLGSIYGLDTFPERISKVILASLTKISPLRVLVKVENLEKLTNIPKNVLTMSWVPQENLLQHPNVKAFITHGGALGTQEAVYYGVPMLCVPYVFDHWSNCDNYVKRKIAIKIDLASITEKEFDGALHEILNNSVYKENVKRLSKVFRNRPMSPLDTAIFWIEYVIKHGKDTLRSPSMDLTWWQLALVDVYAVTIFAIVVIFFAVILVFKKLLSFVRLTSRNLKSLKEKRN